MVEKFNIRITRLALQKGDISKLYVDVIANTANTTLLEGGGVGLGINHTDAQAIPEGCIAIRNR